MSNKLPLVEKTDRVCALIKGEIEEHDACDYSDEDALIQIQEDLMDDEDEPDGPEDHTWMHTHDGGGSYVWTPVETGIWPHENTLTRFTPPKVKR